MVSSIFFSVEILSESLKVVFTRFRTLSHDQARLVCSASLLTGGDRGTPTRWDCVQYLFACLPLHIENSKQYFLGLKFFRFFKNFITKHRLHRALLQLWTLTGWVDLTGALTFLYYTWIYLCPVTKHDANCWLCILFQQVCWIFSWIPSILQVCHSYHTYVLETILSMLSWFVPDWVWAGGRGGNNYILLRFKQATKQFQKWKKNVRKLKLYNKRCWFGEHLSVIVRLWRGMLSKHQMQADFILNIRRQTPHGMLNRQQLLIWLVSHLPCKMARPP